MRNSTFNQSGFFRLIFLIVFLLLSSHNVSAQFYTKHYIAPAPWQYFSKANEIVISTNSATNIGIRVAKSDGTVMATLTAKKGTPAVYRFPLLAKDLPMNALNTVLNGAGLIVTSDGPTAVNLRNIASDDYVNGENVDANIKGNAALTSFGDAGLGIRFRIGYYRDGSLGNFASLGDQRPIYSVMATANNTTVKINNVITATLNEGQSYLFKAAIGTLVETSNPAVMNTSAAIDMPDGCGDGAFNQIPPESVLGTEYFLERGTGNNTAEQTTVVATKDNTSITVESYSATGTLVSSTPVNLALAGNFYTFVNGVANTNFTSSRIVADKRVAVYSGTAQNCEVDISTIAPVSECGGSQFIETTKFKSYSSNNLDYFGYILLRSATDVVTINGTPTTSISGVGTRYQIGSTGWYIINFNSEQIGRPEVLSIESNSKLTVSIVQQAGGFSMAGFFSTFAALPGDPGMTYIAGGGCTNNSAELTTPAGFAPYQWYYNGTAIAGANSPTYTTTKTGNYSVSSTLVCGAQTPSKTVAVTLCTDLGITKTVDNASPCIGSNVEFTVKVSNLGGNNVSGVSVNDLLPSGYAFVSSTPSIGTYNSGTGVWTIGDVEAQSSMTLKIVATVNASGNYTNTASLPNAIDTNTANNSASAAVNPKSSNLVITNPATVCGPATVDLTAASVTTGSTSNMTLSYWTNATATTALASPNAVSTSGTYYIKAISADGCQFIKPVVVSITAQTGTPTISASSTCPTGSVTLTASGTPGTYIWSNGATTQSITVTTDGSYTVRRTNSNGCISNSSAAYVVTFRPNAPTASDQTFCSSENKTVGDLVATGSNIKWYSASTGGTALASSQALVNNTTYYATQTVNTCESSSRTAVLVTVNSKSSAPVAAASQSFCAADNRTVANLAATGGTTRKFYNVSSGGSPLPTTQVLANGDYYVSQTANSCGESDRTKITVTINTIPSAPSASAQTFCASDNRTVSNLMPSGATYKWYDVPSGGTALASTVVLSTKTYYVTETNSCGESSRTSVSITVNSTTAPSASPQVFCSIDAKKVSDLTPSGGTYKWYNANTGGALYAGNETLTTGTYYVTQTLNSCESLRTAVSVTVNNTAAPTASAQNFCSGDSKKVSDLQPSGSAYKWYNSSTGGTAYTGTETLANGNYYVSQTISGCEGSRTLVTVTINPTPATPTISANGATTFCQGGSVTLKSSGGSSYLWSTGETTESITVSASGNYSVQVKNSTGCPSAFSTPTTVTVNAIPVAPAASAQSFCSADAKKVSDLLPSGTAYKWYDVATAGTALQATDLLTTKTYYVSETSNGCEGPRRSVAVTVTTTPLAPTASAQSFCSADAKKVSDLLPSGAAYKWYDVATAGTALQATDVLTTKTYYVSETLNGCEGPRRSVAVTVTTTPSAPALSTITQPTCSSATGSFTITNYNSSYTYTITPSTGVTRTNDVVTVPSGSYTIKATLNSCESLVTNFTVNSQICAAGETFATAVNGLPGGNTAESLILGDKLNNAQAVIGTNPGQVSIHAVTVPTGFTINADGTVKVPANTKAGDYNVEYRICEINNTGNCSTATSVVKVSAPVILAAGETFATAVNGLPGGDTAESLILGDKLNNAQAVIGTNPGQVSIHAVTVPTGFTINSDGTVKVPANTKAGDYNVEYRICEINNTGNCSTATSVVKVSAPVILAAGETFATAVNGLPGGDTAESLILGDKLNNAQAVIGTNPGQVSIHAVTVPTGFTINSDGTVKVPANTKAGDYNVEYRICEINNTGNCSTATSVVKVSAPVILAVGETFPTAVNGLPGGDTAESLILGDKLNNAQAVIGTNPGQVSIHAVTVPTGFTINSDGTVKVPANTKAGDYNVEYRICEINNTGNCSTATSVVKVSAPVILAAGETFATAVNGLPGGDTAESLILGDNLNNAQAVIGTNPGQVSIHAVTVPTGFTINADGTVKVPANTKAGDYNIEYRICEINNTGNCSTATSVVKVSAPVILASAETFPTAVNGLQGGDTAESLILGDKLNNAQAVIGTNPGQVSIHAVTVPTGFTINADGTVKVPANTKAGDYNVEYRICEINNTGNCSTATSVVKVSAPAILAAGETFPTAVNGLPGGDTAESLILGDKLNNAQAVIGTNLGQVSIHAVTVPTGFTINADGTVKVPANTKAGDYNVEYRICEINNTGNCSTATSVVKVSAPVILAAGETFATAVNGLPGGDTTESLILGDKLNNAQAVIGTNPGQVSIHAVTVPTGFTINADGTVKVPANTKAGDYNVEYRICEINNTGNCSTATSVVKVSAPVILAAGETFPTAVNGLPGGDTAESLILGDKLNNAQAVIGTNPGQVSIHAVTVPTGFTINSDGTVKVPANTKAGDYNVEYRICEINNTGNCSTATSVVKVSAPVIDAVVDAITSINGNIGGTTVSLITNDTLNGNPITVGTAPGEVTFNIIGNLPAGLTLNADYTITVAPNTPAANYNVEYRICENTNPSNCDSVTIVVPVTVGKLVANVDPISGVTSSNTPQTLGTNVLDNDTKNGSPLNPSDVTLSTLTPDPTGYLVLNPDGTLTLGANAPAGNYELTYQICEKLNVGNCDSNTVKVTVSLPVIDAVGTTLTPSINGSIGGTTTTSVVEKDTLNGNLVVIGTLPGQVKLSPVNVPSGLTLNADGTVTVAVNTPAGIYNIEYRICEVTNPTNCDTAISKVAVNNGVLVANTDVIPSRVGTENPQTLGVNVFDNDTRNGLPLNPSDVTLTTSTPDPTGYLVLNPDGTVTLGANPPVGTYELTYTICEKLNAGNCSSNTVKITVDMPVIDAVSETLTPSITGSIGGTTMASVIENDTINGKQAVIGTLAGQVKLTPVNVPSGFTLNADGTVTVAINTPSGIYDIEYSICEISNPTNCDSAISKVAVNNGVLVANTDVIPSIKASNTPQTFGVNVFDNDTFNGSPLNLSNVTLTTSTPDPKGYLVLNPDGTLTLGANVPAGNYDLTYTICEKLNSGNCSSNTVRVIVDMPVIDAVADPVTSINGNIGGTTVSLIANDKLNGNPVVVGTAPGEVTFGLISTLPTGLILNADFTITVAPNTPAGNYNVEYRICDNINSGNCDSVISVITVTGGNLVANQDIVPSAVGVNVPQTLINVFANDTKDGNALVPSDVNLSVTIADPKGYLTVDANGNAILAPNAPAGNYELTYTICEKLNPSNCNSNIVKVTVTEPKMTVTANSYCSNNVPYVNYTVTPDNFTTNNKLTVKWIDSANNVVATQTNLDLSGNLIWPGAVVDGNGNGVDWPGWVLNNGQWTLGADGFEATRNGVKIEFSLNPTVTVSVAYPAATSGCNPNPIFAIQANNDVAGPIDVKKGTDAGINVFDNDKLNGVKPTPLNVVLSTVVANPNLILNADGSVHVAANTPNGIYELTYQICETANTSNCSQAVVKVTVLNSVDPAPPTTNAITLVDDINVIADGINGDIEFVNVLNNDLINGQPINPADVTIKPLGNNTYFEFNADGTVNVKPNTPGGSYTITYQVCEKTNGTNCSTAVLNVFVEVPAIAIIKTAEFNDEDNSGFANAGETITYKFTVTNTGNVPLINVKVTDPLTGVVVSGQAISLAVGESNNSNFTAVYKITQEDINLGKVTNQATAQGSSISKIIVEDKSDDLSNDGDNPTVLSLDGCSIKVFNAFSPNGDAKNARFFIRGIECYPNNTVEIYNRWGVLVYAIDQYNNNDRVFVGYSNGRSTIKQTEGLPVGTYFYILKYQDANKAPHEQSGYLYINK